MMILQLLQSKQTRGRERGEGGSPEDARSREGKERKECAALEEEGKESWDWGSRGGVAWGGGLEQLKACFSRMRTQLVGSALVTSQL